MVHSPKRCTIPAGVIATGYVSSGFHLVMVQALSRRRDVLVGSYAMAGATFCLFVMEIYRIYSDV
ncbi:hypothetical protein [uncultured Nitrosomonas sp.]|uniref:hypothetical protein n=1 Tax=uncultured Nitrosomonas sp. TaxID=156424 RepID=UPI0026320E96|nr:hypothetical protein [uncultured Nitrosomonas sp.]